MVTIDQVFDLSSIVDHKMPTKLFSIDNIEESK